MSAADPKAKRHPIWQQFIVGGTSVLPAIVVTHPLDLVKLRQQISGFRGTKRLYSNVFSGIYDIARNEGFKSLLSGLSPAIIRAYTFSATRLGFYEPIRDKLKAISNKKSTEEPSFLIKINSALLSGALATLVGNPFELLKVRMQGGDYNNYKHVFDGLYQVCTKEGIITLWNGTHIAILRASIFSASQLATYDHTKYMLKSHLAMQNGVQLNFSSAMIAGLVTTTVSTPADFIKSVVMNNQASKSNNQSIFSIFRSVVQRDYGKTFFRGWFANYIRLGPHTVITMLTLEKIRYLIGWDTL